MIGYGVCVGPTEKYETICKPALPATAVIFERRGYPSIFAAYNSIMDEAAAQPDLEALVLLHDDVALGPSFEGDLHAALATGAGVIGAVGSVRPHSIAWWKGEPRGRAVELDRVFDYGGGTHAVDTIDGLIMVVARAVVMSIRFDENTFAGFHAYDIDFCFTAQRAGWRIVVAPLDLVHHTKANLGDVNGWRKADLLWRQKWGEVSQIRYWWENGVIWLHSISHLLRQIQ